MKVGIFERNVQKRFGLIVSFIGTCLSLYLIFFEIPEEYKTYLGIGFGITLALVYIVLWIYANKTSKAKIKIGVTSVEIKAGDIFEQEGLKAIAFNEYFDTQVDDRIITRKSLNGQVIEKYFPDVDKLNHIIASDKDLNTSENILETNVVREGNTTKYRLGSSILVDDEFVLTAFSRFNKKNEAQLTMQEYINFLLSFWNEINRVYAQRSVSVPVFGAGITRFRNGFEDIDINELLKIMIWTFKVSKIKFAYPAKLTILIHDDLLSRVNLFEIKENE